MYVNLLTDINFSALHVTRIARPGLYLEFVIFLILEAHNVAVKI